MEFEFKIPNRAFNRSIGRFSGVKVSPKGEIIGEKEWASSESDWLPTIKDQAFVGSLMRATVEPGKIANWIAPPAKGINGQGENFEYVRFN